MADLWIRALLLCDDVRLEVGGTMTLVGTYGDRVIVGPGDGDIELPRLAIYCVIAGLTGSTELAWQLTLIVDGDEPGPPLAEGSELHDETADEHRLVHLMSPISLAGPGKYRLLGDFETRRERRSVEHRFVVERAPAAAE